MAATSMLTTNALARKVWASEDWINLGQRTVFGMLFRNGAVYVADEFKGTKARGDQITYDYVNKLTGIPQGEGGTLDGNEEALNLGSFTMTMNMTRIGVLNPNDDTIEQQRTLVDFPTKTRPLITARHAELVDASLFNQAAGFNPTSYTQNGTTWTGTNKLFVQGHNTPVAPTASRTIRAGGVANDQSLTSANTFSLDLVDFAMEKNAVSDQPIEPLNDGTYALFISPEQAVDLRQDAGSKIQWYNMALAARTGGDKNAFTSNPYMMPEPVASYGPVNIYVGPRVAYGQRSDTSAVITTVRRAVLLGRDAIAFASPFGSPAEASSIKYFTQLKDYDYYKGMEGRMIYGLKNNAPSNGDSIGTIVIPTYAAAHS
jgi:hypothetical protein